MWDDRIGGWKGIVSIMGSRNWKKGLYVGLAVAVLIGLSLLFSHVDYSRVKRGKEPLFSVATADMKDGGSRVYAGLGYRLIALRRITILDGEEAPSGYLVGPSLEFWLPVWPFMNREETTLEPFAKEDS